MRHWRVIPSWTRTAVLLLCLAAKLWAAPTKLVGGLAATVGDSQITIRDAQLYRNLQLFLKSDKLGDLVFETGEALEHTVQTLIFEEIVYQELKSFRVEQVGRARAVELISARKKRAASQAFWAKLLNYFKPADQGPASVEKEATDRLWRGLQVEEFVKSKVETLTPEPTEADVERYLQQNSDKFQKADKQKLRAQIVLLIKKERVDRGLEEWIQSLKKKYPVVNRLESEKSG